MHNDVIFPDFSAFHSTTARAPKPSLVSPALEAPVAPVPETASRSSPETGAPGAAPAANPQAANPQAANPGAAAPGAPATSRALKGRLAAPPFSWLGGDAWPHFPACADHQA